MKPFLKWAGNKYKIVSRIKEKLPIGRRLIEPFAGSAAVFLNTDFKTALVADANADIITLYKSLQEEGFAFVDYCRGFFTQENNKNDAYIQNRTLFNNTNDQRLRAALFLYLNRHGFNGLCRYNIAGKFNVPFGKYTSPYFPKEEMIYFFNKCQYTTFFCGDFETTMAMAVPGDVVYCDPPYVPLSSTANFTNYSAGGFNETQQIRLKELAIELAKKGIPVLISNHYTPFTAEQYAGADTTVFPVQRFISCDGKNRNKVDEVLALFTA